MLFIAREEGVAWREGHGHAAHRAVLGERQWRREDGSVTVAWRLRSMAGRRAVRGCQRARTAALTQLLAWARKGLREGKRGE